MNILFAHPYFGSGGAEKGILTLAAGLKERDCIVSLICIRCNRNGGAPSVFHNIFEYPNHRAFQLNWPLLVVLRNHSIDWIVLNQSFTIAALAIPFAIFKKFNTRLNRTRCVAFERLNPTVFYKEDLLYQFRKLLYWSSLRCCDRLLTNSIEQLLEFNKAFPRKLASYIPNSSTTSHIKNIKPERSKSLILSRKKVLWLGRLTKIKRPILALSCFKYLPNEWTMTVCGYGELIDDCKKYAIENSLDERILFSEDSNICFSDYDCLLFTSEAEGVPNTILEALKSGLPIVTTIFRTGLLEIFTPFWVIFAHASPELLAQKILLSQNESHMYMRENNPVCDLVSNHYSCQNMIESFIDALGPWVSCKQ